MPDKIDADERSSQTIYVGCDQHLLEIALAERARLATDLSAMKAERDDLAKECAGHLRAWETEQAINDAHSRAILAGQQERRALRADLDRAREALWDIAALMRPEWETTRDTRNPLRTLLAAILVRVSEGGFPSGPITAIPPAAQKFGLTSAEVEEIANMRPPKPVALSPDPAPVDPASQEPYEPSRRPKGSNADEWQLFLTEHANASAFLAVQIAEAIDDASKGARA